MFHSQIMHWSKWHLVYTSSYICGDTPTVPTYMCLWAPTPSCGCLCLADEFWLGVVNFHVGLCCELQVMVCWGAVHSLHMWAAVCLCLLPTMKVRALMGCVWTSLKLGKQRYRPLGAGWEWGGLMSVHKEVTPVVNPLCTCWCMHVCNYLFTYGTITYILSMEVSMCKFI